LILTSPEHISENFGESYHCKNIKFENFDESQQKTVHLGELQGSLCVVCHFHVIINENRHMYMYVF